jgi:AcrR family transcriptional regulator
MSEHQGGLAVSNGHVAVGTLTPLERALGDADSPVRSSPLDALRIARERWLNGDGLDMGSLAEELGVSRATLHRWVGNREKLLTEVLWSLASYTLNAAVDAAKSLGPGPEFIAAVVDKFASSIAYHSATRAFLARDPEYALRILISQESQLRQRTTASIRALLVEQVEAGALVPPLDLDSLANLVVRIMESFMYSEQIWGGVPDVSKAATAIFVLLGGQRREGDPS